MIHRVQMTEHTRQQIVANNGVISKKRKGKDGHSAKNRHLETCQKYPVAGRISGFVRHAI